VGTQRELFEQVALPHLDVVLRAAVALCRNRHEAEDLTQSTFVKALERFDSFEPGVPAGPQCKAWLIQILRNTWIDHLRHRKVAGTAVPIDEAMVADDPQEEPVWTDARDLLENFSDEQVIKALIRLPEDQRLTLFLVDVEQCSQEEAAGILGVAVGTVKSRASRARTALRRSLADHARDLGFVKD
jgi:RNA polymerase sigma-70 factor (ECF subfamily)